MQLFDRYHVLSLLVIVVLFLGLFLIFRKRSDTTKYIVLGVVMGLNVFQHLFKFWVWPYMFGRSFSLEETAYNVCAFLILLCPLSVFGKSNFLKQFQFYVGTAAGICAPFLPYWFVGKEIWTSSFLRFWTCHALLFLTSSLPGAWGMVKFRMRDGWKFGLAFLGMLALILLNNAVVFTLLGYSGESFSRALFNQNPVWMMGPPAKIDNFFKDFLVALSFPPFKGTEGTNYTPILWYALPVYVMFTLLGYGLGAAFEALQNRKNKRRNDHDTSVE